MSRLFCQDQDQDQDFYFQDQDQDQDSGSQDQDQDQDFIFCPRGASRPRLWSRGLHHWLLVPLSSSFARAKLRLMMKWRDRLLDRSFSELEVENTWSHAFYMIENCVS